MFRRNSSLFPKLGLVLTVGLNLGMAALDFDTYRIINETFRVNRRGESVDSTRTTYELSRLGSTSLEASSLTLTSYGSYINVIEEATLTGNIEHRPHDITQDFLFQGSLPIPPLAAVRSLSAIHGDTVFQAKLRKMTYSLNDVFFDTASLKTTLNSRVAFLQQLSDISFEATFSKISLGDPIRVRIVYDIPFSGAPGATLRIPVLFHPSGNAPKQSQITFYEKARELPELQLLRASGRITLDDSGTHTFEYQNEFQLRRNENPKTIASLQTTTFESGKFKGNYLLFKTGLNDSLMNLLSRPLEVTFLWRWNPPYNFVGVQNGLKTISPLGQLVATEARTLRQIILELSPRGHRFGLMRSAPGFEDTLFAPAEEGKAEYKKILAYLDQFTEERIYADYKDFKNDKPEWAVSNWSDSGEIVKSRQGFLSNLGRIRKAFSNRPVALQHIEVIGFGSAPASIIDLKDPKFIEAIIDSVTLSNVLAPWLGVDMVSALRLKANDFLRPLVINSPLANGLPPLLFPVFQPTSVEYRTFTASRSHAVVLPFSMNAEREAIIKAESPFEDTVQLQGIDALGHNTRIFTFKPRMQRSQADSSLARIWAADPDRIAEVSEVDMGMRYGILTKGSYWGAGIEDGIFIAPDLEGTPILPKTFQAGSGHTFQLSQGFLRIESLNGFMGARGRHPKLDVYDVRGRLLLSLSLEKYLSPDGFAIPVDILNRLGQSRIFLVLRGSNRLQSFSLNLGIRK
jgi:hypothetical protein